VSLQLLPRELRSSIIMLGQWERDSYAAVVRARGLLETVINTDGDVFEPAHPINGNEQPSIVLPLRVYRVQAGTTVMLRTLANSYKGLFLHFHNKRSHLCRGEQCPREIHQVPPTWKGYTPVELFEPSKAKWLPAVLEVTEHLDLDFRHLFKRGQIWEIFRDSVGKRKGTPVCGKLLEERDGKTFPAAFDVVKVLLTMYHVQQIRLDQDNPMPDRSLVTYSEGDAPACTKTKPVDIDNDPRPVSERFKEYMNQKKSPHTNGTPH
jgi:hypothetical protein